MASQAFQDAMAATGEREKNYRELVLTRLQARIAYLEEREMEFEKIRGDCVARRAPRPREMRARAGIASTAPIKFRFIGKNLFTAPLYAVTDTELAGDPAALCVICEVRPVNMCINPCGHAYMCRACALFGRSQKIVECAICKTVIQSVIPYAGLSVERAPDRCAENVIN